MRRGRAFNHRCQFNEGEFGKQSSVAQKTTEKKTKNKYTQWPTEFCSCYCCLCVCVCPFQAIRRPKHDDIFRPSYSNQKIKVPLFFPSCPLLGAIAAKQTKRQLVQPERNRKCGLNEGKKKKCSNEGASQSPKWVAVWIGPLRRQHPPQTMAGGGCLPANGLIRYLNKVKIMAGIKIKIKIKSHQSRLCFALGDNGPCMGMRPRSDVMRFSPPGWTSGRPCSDCSVLKANQVFAIRGRGRGRVGGGLDCQGPNERGKWAALKKKEEQNQ